MEQRELVEQINELKKEKNAVIIGHYYQNVEIDLVADYVGDSLYLSQIAAKVEADTIVFAGVYFMAETAKILSPNKKVLLPRTEAGCLMAEMIDVESLREFKAQNPNIPVVCYVNSTAEIKAECDICCTSANAVKVVKSLNVPKVLFVPDKWLGTYVNNQLDDVEVIVFPGFCPTHMRLTPKDINAQKEKYPNAMVLVHPECTTPVVEMADYVGSTSGIIKTAMASDKKEFIIVTEKGVVDRLERDCPDKTFVLPSEKAICENMKWNTLEDIYNSLKYDQHEIFVDEEVSKKAYTTIARMLEVK